MRKIQAGHELTFVAGDDTVVTRVKRVTEYSNFEALLDHEDAAAIGGDLDESRDKPLTAIQEIYPPGKKKLGVLTIQIKRVRDAYLSSPAASLE